MINPIKTRHDVVSIKMDVYKAILAHAELKNFYTWKLNDWETVLNIPKRTFYDNRRGDSSSKLASGGANISSVTPEEVKL